MRALKDLEEKGFIIRRSQFHDSGAQRSTRYYLNHPQAPYMAPSPGAGPRHPKWVPPPSQPKTEGVSHRDPLNPPFEPSTEPGTEAIQVLNALPAPWKFSRQEAEKLAPAIEKALACGWTPESLAPHISRNPGNVRNPARVMARRLRDLAYSPTCAARGRVAWCGECEDERSRTITVVLPDGTEAATFRPRCSPQAHRDQALPAEGVN
jgi:hypothetical protein